jgi:hypothetical protein
MSLATNKAAESSWTDRGNGNARRITRSNTTISMTGDVPLNSQGISTSPSEASKTATIFRGIAPFTQTASSNNSNISDRTDPLQYDQRTPTMASSLRNTSKMKSTAKEREW